MLTTHSIPANRCVFLCLLAMFSVGGCAQLAQRSGGESLTQSDLLQRHYEDLSGGRFAILADFESSAHAEIFRVEDGGLVLDPEGGIAATGKTCLSVYLPDEKSQLIADNSAAKTWLVKRDWRMYDLFILNVFSPVPELQLDLAIVSGADATVREAHSLIPLVGGWNLLRLDLNEASDFIALDDVRQLRFSASGSTEPVELKFDDILLANNRLDVFGSAEGPTGEMYVVREGRRLSVGAADRFELGFANGQIVRWYALEDDPLRLRDLVGAGNTLGPMPVVLPENEGLDEAAVSLQPVGFGVLGKTVQARQRVVEANEVRVVVECIWTFADGESSLGDDAPQQRWRYVIYPSGQVYVTVESPADYEGFSPGHVGLVVSRFPIENMVVDIHEPAQLRDPPSLRHVCYGWSSTEAGGAGLLYVLHDSRKGPRMRVVRSAEEQRVGFLACGGAIDRPVDRWHCLLHLWHPEANGVGWQVAAVAYAGKRKMEFLVGGLAKDSSGDENRDGFDEQSGATVLEPDGNRVQFKLDGRTQPLVSPVFRVANSVGREAWVYVNYVVYENTARDADGDLLFQLPGTIDREMVVEVYLRQAPATVSES